MTIEFGSSDAEQIALDWGDAIGLARAIMEQVQVALMEVPQPEKAGYEMEDIYGSGDVWNGVRLDAQDLNAVVDRLKVEEEVDTLLVTLKDGTEHRVPRRCIEDNYVSEIDPGDLVLELSGYMRIPAENVRCIIGTVSDPGESDRRMFSWGSGA